VSIRTCRNIAALLFFCSLLLGTPRSVLARCDIESGTYGQGSTPSGAYNECVTYAEPDYLDICWDYCIGENYCHVGIPLYGTCQSSIYIDSPGFWASFLSCHCEDNPGPDR